MHTKRSNLEVERGEKKLRLLVPSALRAPTARHFYVVSHR